MLRMLVDFNDIRDDAVGGLPEDVEGSDELREGGWILLHDDGEHEALGRVTEAGNDLVRAQIDWSTWGGAGRYMTISISAWGDVVTISGGVARKVNTSPHTADVVLA
jgi:hypothetical protein